LGSVVARELPEDGQQVADDYVAKAVSSIVAKPDQDESDLRSDTPQGRLAASYLLAILEGDRQGAAKIVLDAAGDGWTIMDLYNQVLAPAQREVGRMWLKDEINVADEHLATATTKSVMSRLRGLASEEPVNGKTVVAAAVQNNQHDLGLLMVADVFELHGWRTIALGASLPIVDLIQATETHQADLLLISAALGSQLPAVRDTIRAVRANDATKQTKIIVGGPAFVGVADLATEYGADGYAADATEAVKLGNQLAGV
jgi:methanogenic corrinoid protein MtbC1